MNQLKIGITDAERVLGLLSDVDPLQCEDLSGKHRQTHLDEVQLRSLTVEFVFLESRMKDKIADKNKILTNLIKAAFGKKYSAGCDDLLRLIKNLYRVITSSIQTLDADSVEV